MKKLLIVVLSILIIPCVSACEDLSNLSINDETNLKVTYTVTFNYDNGQENYIERLSKGSKVTEIATPTKASTQTEEYEFLGWYNGETKWDFELDKVNSNLILTARWGIKKYTADLSIRR